MVKTRIDRQKYSTPRKEKREFRRGRFIFETEIISSDGKDINWLALHRRCIHH